MSSEISGIESEKSENPGDEYVAGKSVPDESKPRRSGGALAFLAFLIAIAALAGTAWMWWQDQSSMDQGEQRMFAEIARLDSTDNELSLKLNQVRGQISTLAADDSSTEFEAMQQRMQADRSKMGQVEKALEEQMSLARSLQSAADSLHGRMLAAEAALTGMSTRELDAGGELDIAEVDYLLRLANERLKLFSDPVAADQALEVADMHLAALDNPMYLGVRQDIAAARQALASIEIPDYLDISSRLNTIQQEIASLPFQGGDTPAAGTGPVEEEGWWQKLKGVFSNLVTVRRSTEEENQRISLQDKDYIRQSVWLQLEVAQLALMRQDQEVFRSALKRVEESLSAWFDAGDERYKQVMQGIEELAAIEVHIDVPDITAPWSSLRLIKTVRPAPPKTPPPQESEAPAEPAEEDVTG